MLNAEDTRRKLFRPHTRAMKCRQMIWSEAKARAVAAGGEPVPLADLVRDHKGEFRSAEIYRAAKTLVTHGALTREDISWAVIEKGSELTRYRCAVRYVEPFTEASRSW